MIERRIDFEGLTIGHLRVLRFKETNRTTRSALWVCKCECGSEVIKSGTNLSQALKKKSRISCGCKPTGRKPQHGMSKSSEFRTWMGMKSRCYNKTHHKYPLYGAKGVCVHKEWRKSFQAFFDYVGPKPTPKHTLDRIKPDGNYEPGNVRWATPLEQRHNRRKG